MDNKTLKLSIIILNYKTKKLTNKCINFLYKYPINCNFEIIVVDNNSQDNTIQYLEKKWKNHIKTIASNINKGFGGGINLGIKKAKGQYILTLNPDIEVWKNSINYLLDFIKNNPNCAICGPQLIYPDGTIQDSYRRFPTLTDLFIKRTFLRKIFKKRMSKYLMHQTSQTKTQPVDWMIGGFLMIRQNFLQEISGFDERFFLFLEDTDICRQAWNKNQKVMYVPQAKAYHHHKRLSGNNFLDAIFKKTFYIHISSALKYWWKWKNNKPINKSIK